MHDLATIYTIHDLADMHEAMDEEDENLARMRDAEKAKEKKR